MEARCSHCGKRPGRIEHNGLKCWLCYGVEQQMAGNEDWRDCFSREYQAKHDMVKRKDETKTNLANRCKLFLAKNGFTFHEQK